MAIICKKKDKDGNKRKCTRCYHFKYDEDYGSKCCFLKEDLKKMINLKDDISEHHFQFVRDNIDTILLNTELQHFVSLKDYANYVQLTYNNSEFDWKELQDWYVYEWENSNILNVSEKEFLEYAMEQYNDFITNILMNRDFVNSAIGKWSAENDDTLRKILELTLSE